MRKSTFIINVDVTHQSLSGMVSAMPCINVKVQVILTYDPCVGEVPVREDTCPGPSAL